MTEQPRVEITADEIFALAMDTPQVRSAIQGRASRIAARTRRELRRAGIEATVSLREHGLSNGRVSYDVVVDPLDPKNERRAAAIARRAQREVRR